MNRQSESEPKLTGESSGNESESDLEICLRQLDLLCQNPELCLAPNSPYSELIQKSALLLKRIKTARKRESRSHDQELAERTAIRQKRTEKELGTYLSSNEPGTEPDSKSSEKLWHSRSCYICKRSYRELHHFYDLLCPNCAAENMAKREHTANLRDRSALITGGRIKIGFQIALKLLRAGADVMVTSRFPMDTAMRYSREVDFGQWANRLSIYSADFRFLPAVATMSDQIAREHSKLDILINNAAQTVRRPPEYYEHLIESEKRLATSLSSEALDTIQKSSSQTRIGKNLDASPSSLDSDVPVHIAAMMSQARLLDDDGQHAAELFPVGKVDNDGQQIDKRPVNSWIMELADVPFVELLEVHAVNSLASFMLINRLYSLLMASPNPDRYVVNVSAVEGQFGRVGKTGFHPHTNMAKAGMNMVTKTCGERFARQGIYMTSVDTGWVTNEFPYDKTEDMKAEGFEPPLDEIDGAARVCDPIFVGVNEAKFVYGIFLKGYREASW